MSADREIVSYGDTSDIAGAFRITATTRKEYAGLGFEDLANYAQQRFEDADQSIWDIGDAAMLALEMAGENTVARAKAREEFLAVSHLDRDFFNAAIRRSRAFPSDLRREFKDKKKTWFANLTDRTGLATDTPEQRFTRIRELAEVCREMSPAEVREYIDTTLGPLKRQAKQQLGLPLGDDSEAPTALEPPTPQAEHVRHEATVESLPSFRDLLARYHDGLTLEWFKVHGHKVPVEILGALAEHARQRAAKVFGPYLEERP